jgi:hypothetical protein
MATKTNERQSTAIDVSSTDQTIDFNKLIITTAGTLVFQDGNGNDVTVPGTVPVGSFEAQGKKIYKVGTTITGIACSY